MKKNITLLKFSLTTLALFLVTSYSNAQTLTAHYKFDNNLNDETGNWNLSASSGFTPTFVTGQDATANGAVSGFTAADYLETATNFSISGSTSRTMVAWIKMTSTVAAGQAIVGLGLPATGERWTFQVQGVKLRIEIQGKGFNVSSPDLVVDTWYHVAVVWQSGLGTDGIKLYLNGAGPLATNNWEGFVNTAPSKLRIGNDYNVAEPGPQLRGFTGAIDDLRIYAEALSGAQILTIYNATLLGSDTFEKINGFKAYPNPVKDRLYFSTNKIASVEIYNLLGAKIKSQNILNDGIDMSSLTKGIYLVKCIDKQGLNVATLKTVKE